MQVFYGIFFNKVRRGICISVQMKCIHHYWLQLKWFKNISLMVWLKPPRPRVGGCVWCCLTLSHTWAGPAHNFHRLCCHGCSHTLPSPQLRSHPPLTSSSCRIPLFLSVYSGNYTRVRWENPWHGCKQAIITAEQLCCNIFTLFHEMKYQVQLKSVLKPRSWCYWLKV